MGSIADALFGKTRRVILAFLFTRPDQSFYLREITRMAAAGQGSVQRELLRLTEAGILQRTTRGRSTFYQANHASPVFNELQGLFTKTAGVADVIGAALGALAEGIRVGFVYGSAARQELRVNSDVDLLVVGDVSFGDVVQALANAQRRIGRDINPTVYTPAEFLEKVRVRHHFVTSVLREPKIFVVGDQRELERLGKKPMAGRAHHERGRNPRPARGRRPRSQGQRRRRHQP